MGLGNVRLPYLKSFYQKKLGPSRNVAQTNLAHLNDGRNGLFFWPGEAAAPLRVSNCLLLVLCLLVTDEVNPLDRMATAPMFLPTNFW